MLRWRLLHYRHKFEHVANDSNLPTPVTGSVIAEANAEELRQSQCFLSWKDAFTMHSLRSDLGQGSGNRRGAGVQHRVAAG